MIITQCRLVRIRNRYAVGFNTEDTELKIHPAHFGREGHREMQVYKSIIVFLCALCLYLISVFSVLKCISFREAET